MKTIKQIADELNTTPQNIYNHLKRNNISRASLKHKKQGKQVFYDADAETIIKDLLEKPVNEEKGNNENNETFEMLNAEIKRLKGELENAIKSEAAAQEEITRLRENERQLMTQVSSLIDAQKALSVVAATNRLQAAPEEKKGIFTRIRGLLKGNKSN